MSQISATEAPNMQQIDLTTLSIQQLTTLKQQLDQVCNRSITYISYEVILF